MFIGSKEVNVILMHQKTSPTAREFQGGGTRVPTNSTSLSRYVVSILGEF